MYLGLIFHLLVKQTVLFSALYEADKETLVSWTASTCNINIKYPALCPKPFPRETPGVSLCLRHPTGVPKVARPVL